jgi:mersacidin/lichenicidin family type 2 lantibiotic
MSIQDIIRAWEDPDFFASLNAEQRALLPANPIGDTLSRKELVRRESIRQITNGDTEGMACSACGTLCPPDCIF